MSFKVDVAGDGSGEVSLAAAAASGVTTYASDAMITAVMSNLSGFALDLYFQGTPNLWAYHLSDGPGQLHKLRKFGGVQNTATDRTGNILFSTTGLGNGDKGTFVFALEKL